MASVWQELFPATSPSPRTVDGAIALDRLRGKVVLFGGAFTDPATGHSTGLTDTWEWDGTDWTQVVTAHHPPVTTFPLLISCFRLSWDPVNNVVLCLADDPNTGVVETWTYDGADWTKLSPAATPVPRPFNYHLSTDLNRLRVVYVNRFGAVNETWEWDGTNWVNRGVPLGPPATLNASEYVGMAYDETRGLTVALVFSPALAHSETFEWNGTTWALVSTSMNPPFPMDLSWSASCGRVLGWTGAHAAAAHTWIYFGNWAEVSPSPSPPPRAGGGFVNTADSDGAALLFGGEITTPSPHDQNDTWSLACGPKVLHIAQRFRYEPPA